ncbi:hypothetical protein [Geomonas propionica]|uniref:Uncharacterized protein n=1 Tax=Geomonas propionica TaxID=2798582 RepID=A0ABS0YS24_9BACT|nr:hypothetical protein [Geomonas propionica]MBJ6800721.1 hypothetical protein [Geomonas propionica]
MDTFDAAYANYLKLLAKLDKTDDITEKNQIFRQLTQLLCELEQGLKNKSTPSGCREELAYWL